MGSSRIHVVTSLNYDPFLGTLNKRGRLTIGTPKEVQDSLASHDTAYDCQVVRFFISCWNRKFNRSICILERKNANCVASCDLSGQETAAQSTRDSYAQVTKSKETRNKIRPSVRL